MRALKKEKQQEWKESHKNEVKKYNKIYYEQNKEAIKQKKKEQYNLQKDKN